MWEEAIMAYCNTNIYLKALREVTKKFRVEEPVSRMIFKTGIS
jgi:hypothetical protein